MKKRTLRHAPGAAKTRRTGKSTKGSAASSVRPLSARDAQARVRSTFEQAAVGIAHLSRDELFIKVNRRYCQIVGYDEEELIGQPSGMLNHPDDLGIGRELRERLLSGAIEHFSQEKRYFGKDRTLIWVRRTESLGGAAGEVQYFIRVVEDITDRKATEERLARANRARAVLADCSRALVHAPTEPDLLDQMCAIAVQSGGYSHAWIGLKVDDERQSVRMGAHAGFAATLPTPAEITWADDGRYQGVTGSVIATGKTHVARNIPGSASSVKRQAAARRCGYEASLTLPLALRERCFGAISIYTEDASAFDEEEIALLVSLAHDISFGIACLREQRRREDAELALRASEERFRAAFEQAAVGMALRDIDPRQPRWLRVNQKFCEIVGYSREELLDLTSVDLTPAEDRQEARQYNERLLRGDTTSYTRDKRYRAKGGRIVWVNLSVSVLCSADGKPTHIVSVVHDITQRKHAEARSRESEQRYREVFEQAAVGITRVDLNGVYVDANEKFARMLGYRRSEILGRAVRDFTHPDDYGQGMGYRHQLAAGDGASASGEKRFVRRDGSVVWTRRTMSPALDSQGNRSYIISVVEDITERKEIEVALRESERFARATIDGLTERICVIDEAGRIVIANDAWRKLAAMNDVSAEGAAEGASYFDICERATGMQRRHALLARSGIGEVLSGARQAFSAEYACTTAALERWCTLRATLFPGEGPRRAVLTHEDVTDQVLSARRRAMEFAVSSSLAEAPTLAAAIPQLLRTMCEAMGWAYGARWMRSESDDGVVRAEYWSDTLLELDPTDAHYWNRMTSGGAGGLLRRVLSEREPTWLVDIRNDLTFRRRATCEKLGFVSAYAFPILAANQVVGVLEFFGREPQPPDQTLLLITRSIGTQIGQFIQRKEAEEALKVSEETFRATFKQASVGITACDLALKYLQVNDHFCELVGYTREELLNGMGPADVNMPGDVADISAYRQKLMSGEVANHVREKQLRTKEGSAVWVAVVTSVVRGEKGIPQHFISIVQDVSARRAAEHAMRESEEKFRQLADNIPEIFWITDNRQRRLIYLSPGFEPLTGMRIHDVKGRPRSWLKIVHPDDYERVRAARAMLPNGDYDIEYRVVRPDGSVRWIHDQAFPVRDVNGNVYRIAGIGADITHRKESEEKLVYLAHYDGLTALPNRVLFLDRLRQTIAQADRREAMAAVIFLDLDRFKLVNDTLGHAIGDELLRHVGQRLAGCVRIGDTVSRFSGDEFVLLLNDLHNPEEGRVVAQKILAEFAEPFRISGREIFVSTSIGISMYPLDAEDDQALLKNADAAMYRAKESGRNNFQFYTSELNARATFRLELENSLRRALERCEFRLHYQPKVRVSSGEIIGVEALLRWERPGYGLVSPGEFIPLLEETGLIVSVGEWVVAEACRQLRAWNDAGAKPLPIAINISGRQFATRDVGDMVKRVLDEHGTDPRYIELELTESVLMVNTEEAVRTLGYLKGLGLALSIDDFGTGYSSLAYLKRFPIDSLKIDRSFIDQVTTDVGDATITRAVIGMAHNLGLNVIAEGVETLEQLDFLVANACDEAQGQYFSMPVPPSEILRFLRSGRRLGARATAEEAVLTVP